MTLLRHITGRALWLVAGLVLATAAWRAFSPSQPDKADTWLQVGDKYRWTVRLLLGQREAMRIGKQRLADSFRLIIARRDTAIAFYQDEVRTIPPGPPGRELMVLKERCDDALAVDATLLRLCQQRGDSAQKEANLYHALYQTAAPRLAQADTLIAANVRANDCKILFVHCPSRTTTGEVALLLGTILGWVLHR